MNTTRTTPSPSASTLTTISPRNPISNSAHPCAPFYNKMWRVLGGGGQFETKAVWNATCGVIEIGVLGYNFQAQALPQLYSAL